MRYPGAFTFINRDTTTTPDIKDYKHDTAISTHISRTRRRWTEEKRKVRLDQLGRSERKFGPVNTKVAIPKNSSPLVPSPNDPVGIGDVFDQSTPDHKCEGEQTCPHCIRSRTAAPSSKHTQRTIPPIRLLKGNSDPFSASSLPITPEIHELLELSSRFYVFWAWSVSASSLFRFKARDSWLASVRAALSVQGAAEMCVVVASGASVKARLLDEAHNVAIQHRQEAQALIHKMRALKELRCELSVEAPLAYPAIFRLVSLEFHDGNYQAALWHHKAVSELLDRNKSLQARRPSDSGDTTYAVAEVWLAAAALERPAPCGMVDWSGERRVSNDFGVPREPGLFLYDLEWPNLHLSVKPLALRTVFRNIQKLTLYMDKLSALGDDGVLIYEAVIYLGARSSSLRAEILNMRVDFNSRQDSKDVNGSHADDVDDLVYSTSCLAALLFINIIFMYKAKDGTAKPAVCLMSTSVNRQPLHCLQDLLQRIQSRQPLSQHSPTPARAVTVDPELWTWLCFIAGLVETLEAESQAASRRMDASVANSTGVGLQSFGASISMLGLIDRRDVRGLLRRFLYFGGLMDEYLQSMLELL